MKSSLPKKERTFPPPPNPIVPGGAWFIKIGIITAKGDSTEMVPLDVLNISSRAGRSCSSTSLHDCSSVETISNFLPQLYRDCGYWDGERGYLSQPCLEISIPVNSDLLRWPSGDFLDLELLCDL